MRDLAIFALVFGALFWVLRRPALGVLLFIWLSLMNPHRLAYGPAYDFPFAAVVVAATLAGVLVTRNTLRLPRGALPGLLLAFMLWASVTSFMALQPALAWTEWNRVMKTLLMALVAMTLIEDEQDIKLLAWVLGLSLLFYGVKGGLFTVATGGSYRVLGPEGSYIEDNNSLALALVMAAPIAWYLQQQAQRRWLRWALVGVTVLALLAAAGSYSRGALLAGAAMLAFIWLKSEHKGTTTLVFLLLVPLLMLVMPPEWFERMATISSYRDDTSAMGRINAWYFAANVAAEHKLGGGFNVFTPDMFRLYAPDPLDFHAAHSIYFQVLGEHGYVGLVLFLALLVCAWRSAARTIRLSQGQPHLLWAGQLAAMVQVSLVAYAVGGAFLSLAYYDYFYFLIALLVLLQAHATRSRLAAPGSAVHKQQAAQPLAQPQASLP
jgi:putative inorganic carbon (HCO3(-)) transporter